MAMSSNDDDMMYGCPVYKTAKRRSCNRTGDDDDDNFITELSLNCNSMHSAEHWILRGCALLCDLDN